MKWIAGFLLLANAGMFLWATGHRPDSTEFIRPMVNGETMMLLSEVTPRESRSAASTDDPEQGGEPPEPALCLRIGPFHDAGLASETSGRLSALSIPFESRTVKSREIRAYRVYIGPFLSKTALEAQQKLLVDGGITEHYVKREPGQRDIISLGLFSQNTGADAIVNQLKEKGITALTRTEDRVLNPTYWLELTDSDANRAAQSRLAAINWGDDRTRLSEFPCS